MTDRPTGRTVTLPLVWRGDALYVGPFWAGEIQRDIDYPRIFASEMNRYVFGVHNAAISTLRTRSAAMRAVEDAVIAALGGGGDAE